jgi:hypothetical protein
MKFLLFILFLTSLFVFGCTELESVLPESKSPEEIVFSNLEVKDFIKKNPDYLFSFKEYPEKEFLKELSFWQQCPVYVKEDNFYLAAFETEDLKFYFLFDQADVSLICGLYLPLSKTVEQEISEEYNSIPLVEDEEIQLN